ncbi:uncharacterized protein LOC132053160 isoform X5 [Lycium ferocissimum]|uniref:uncharacterized protein LOC132053160 isoform X5 n=1 Tax=Lycium ferocissimum TaxID=112874 RepID=UPI002815B977|nr:uncharacterized protein LOC132053160 isoform X5 [Lycium ferocissimum]
MYEETSMADDVMIKHDQLTNNPCCITWEDKYIKLKEGYTKLEERRNALRKGLSIYEQQVKKMQSENLSLTKAVDDEKLRANNEKEEKVKESALRVSLESEVARLKNEILSLKKNDGGREITELKEHLSQRETKVNELNELLEKERLRADSEKKKADLERKKADDLRTKWKAEKTRAVEERRLADVERKRAEGNRLNLENLKKEADQLKSKLASVTLEFEDAKKKLEAERENTSKERKRADAAVMKAADQKKIAETNHKIAMDEKSRATDLYRQLEQDRREIDNLKKEISELMSSGKMVNTVPREGTTLGTAQLSSELGPGAVERDVTMVDVTLNSGAAQKRIQEMEQEVLVEKKRVKSAMKKKKKQRKAAEAYKKKASEEKDRADQLSEEVENYRKKADELQKEIEKLVSARSFVACPLRAYDSNLHVETAKGKLLKKQLKFEKKLVKHAKEVAKFENTRNYILQQNLLSLKQEFVHFSRRLNILDGCFSQGDGHDLEKVCSFNLKSNYSGFEACDMHCHLGNDPVQLGAVVSDPSKQKINCSVPSLPVCGGNNPGSISASQQVIGILCHCPFHIPQGQKQLPQLIREKTCVLLSLLLLHISDTVTRAFGDDWERDLVLFINTVSQHIYKELSLEDTRRIFVESCNLYDVLSLMEDFLLHGKLLVHAVSSDSKLASDSGINLILDGRSISLCKQRAPTQLLLIGGILLASVCAAVDHVGFVCEASCNILRMLRSDALNILHVFAYLCGSKYFTFKEYGLAMTVVKSLVMLIHKNRSSPSPLSCVPSSFESLSRICSGCKCPFSEGATTMDVVASSLLDSLKNYACSAVGSDLMESLNSSRRGIRSDGRITEESSDGVDLVQSAYVTSGDSCQLIDTLALVELVAGFMSWDWMFDNIACPLLDLLEYCSTEHNAAAITTLLGQLGRSGVKAFGYEDVRIQRLRSSLCALLCQCDSKRMGLHLQFSIGIALIGLIPLRFEQLVGSNTEVTPAADPCDPTDCLRKWFALLSSEQRLLFKACKSCQFD